MRGLFSFGFPFFLKVVIPGIVATLFLSPLVASLGIKLGINLEMLTKPSLNVGLRFATLVFLIGFLLYFLDDTIYKIFEGYKFWPSWLREKLTKRLKQRVKKEFDKYYDDPKKRLEEKPMIVYWLKCFPLKKGRTRWETEATLPTKLGNILAAYESYPESRYGIDSVFFWPRIWLSLDDETRKEIDRLWSGADCLTYISFALLCAGMFYIIAFILHLLNIPTLILGLLGGMGGVFFQANPISPPPFFLILGLVSLAFSYLSYWLSLPLHVDNGGLFQSIYDIHKDKIEKLLEKKQFEECSANLWYETWMNLDYMEKKCNKCHKYYPIPLKTCPRCEKNKKN